MSKFIINFNINHKKKIKKNKAYRLIRMDKFISLIDNSVGNVQDNSQQKQSEAQLKQLLEQRPDEYIQMLLSVLKSITNKNYFIIPIIHN